MLFGEELSGWGAAAVSSLVTAILLGLGALVVKVLRAKGGYVRDVTEASILVSDADRKARREKEDADRRAQREDEDAERRQESAILKEYKQLVVEQKADIADQRKQIHDLRDEMYARDNKCAAQIHRLNEELAVSKAGRAKADERIAALEEALEEAQIPHRKWLPDDGSGPHRPLGEGP